MKNYFFNETVKFSQSAKLKKLMKMFTGLQLGYCSLVWLNKIRHLHEISLRVVFKDNTSSIKDLIKQENATAIHERNMPALAIKLNKIKTNRSNKIK